MTEPSDHPRILILTHTPIGREPRALKQIDYFVDRADVTTAGFGRAPRPGVEHIELDPEPKVRGLFRVPGMYPLLLSLRQYPLLEKVRPRTRDAYTKLKDREWDVIIAHDVQTLGLARRLQSRRGILVDLHEYAPRQNEFSTLWRLLIAPYYRWICRTMVPEAASVTTVGQGIVDEYKRIFGFEPTLVVNATPFHDLEPKKPSSPIRLVHSGIPAPARKLEVMIEAVKATTNHVTLDLFLIQDGSAYYEHLVRLADDDPRITFQQPVPYEQLVSTLNEYDVGLSVIAPTTFNLAWCLPNKFFDFVQARLGVVVGPSPEMARFVDRYRIGAVADDFSSDALRRVLDSLNRQQVTEWKRASHDHARELSSDVQVKVWGAEVDRILNQSVMPRG